MCLDIARFLFWNIHHQYANLVRSLEYSELNQIDVVALCEMPDIIPNTNIHGYSQIEHIDSACNDIGIFIRTLVNGEKNYFREKPHFCLLRLNQFSINFLVMHLNSGLYNSRDGRVLDISIARSDIERIEKKYGDKRTLIVGDMNIGLFDEEMLSFNGFNACFFKSELKKQTRTLHGEKRDLLYNPMLQVYKDSREQSVPKGTYYYNQPPYWFCFDHILMKPELVPYFTDNSLTILGKLGDYPLITNNKPIKTVSDHMPVQFELEVSK